MASKIDIYNMALGWVGVAKVASDTEASPGAIACNLYYTPCREQLLRDHWWNFATRRVSLAGITVPNSYPEYAYAYAYPSDCLQARGVLDALGQETDFRVDLNDTSYSRMILCNTDSAVLHYTRNVETTTLFDSHFVQALARRLASDIAKEFARNNFNLIQELEGHYEKIIASAYASDAMERKRSTRKNPWIDARHSDLVFRDIRNGNIPCR